MNPIILQSPLRKNPIINYNPERMLERAPFHSTVVTASCLTTARSRQLSDSFATERELVNKYPLFVSWYCAVRLELILKTVVVPLYGASAYIAVFEWSPTGGMVHLHYICLLYTSPSPRDRTRSRMPSSA